MYIITLSRSSTFINIHILKVIYIPLRIKEITNTTCLNRIKVTLKFGFSWWVYKRRKPCDRKSSKYGLNALPSRLLHPACLFFLQLFNSLHMKTNKLDTWTRKCSIFSKHLLSFICIIQTEMIWHISRCFSHKTTWQHQTLWSSI